MTKHQFQVSLLVILAAVAESGDDGIPSGHVYAAVMNKIDINEYQDIVSLLVTSNLVTSEYHLLRVTERGMVLGMDVSKALREQLAEDPLSVTKG